MNLQGILFDIDGTLVDSNDIHARCWLEAFEHFGKSVEWDVILRAFETIEKARPL